MCTYNFSLLHKEKWIEIKPNIKYVTMERIHQVLGNLVRTFNITQTYVDEDDPW